MIKTRGKKVDFSSADNLELFKKAQPGNLNSGPKTLAALANVRQHIIGLLGDWDYRQVQ